MRTGVLELSHLPHALLDLANLFLINKEEAGRLSEPCDFRNKQEIMNVLQHIVEVCLFFSTDLEPPQVIMCIPWPFPQVMVRERIQWPSILTAVPWNDSNDVGVRTHDNPSVLCWNTPSFTVCNDAGDKIDPAVEIEP